MSGEWTGGAQNRHWQRAGHRGGHVQGDAARGRRLWAELAGEAFWCESCGGSHPLREHAACRDGPDRAWIQHTGRALVNALNPTIRNSS